MHKSVYKLVLFTLAIVQAFFSFSQDTTAKKITDTGKAKTDTLNQRFQLSIFTPLYLDSAFDAGNNYRYGKTFPRFINPGLEFYEGAQLAIDSLQKERVPLDVHIYDTRSAEVTLPDILNSAQFGSSDMIIGHVSAYEAKLLANAAATKKIPFINANFPNDAGVTNNPNYIILNSTLLTHCTAIYKFLQKNYALSPIVVFRKAGQQEDRLQEYFTQVEKNTAGVPLKLKFVTLPDNFSGSRIAAHLDADKTNVCVVASLDVNFGERVSEQLVALTEMYASTVVGMPTWDTEDFSKAAYKGLEVVYSTPFYIPSYDRLVTAVQQDFKNRFFSRPSDMVFRGYETVYHFSRLLLLHKSNIASSLSDKKYKIFTDFDIQPVINPQTMTLDYYENKKIYFVKKVDGVVKAVY